MLCPNRTLLSSIVRHLNTCQVCCNHYDVLGVTPKATQTDIKAAYYKLSMIHHPDKSTDETSVNKFRAINEAYKVLGNFKLKKMYDKGLLTRDDSPHTTYHPDPEPQDPTLKFYKAHSRRQVAPTMRGKEPIYDFDAWSKNHYGNMFHKTKLEKEFARDKHVKAKLVHNAVQQEKIVYGLFTFVALVMLLVIHSETDYDLDSTKSTSFEQDSEM